ncbi:hypothetical protein I6G46_22995 [Serratia plymuthica]|uniref:hypothetical protein n=1 Tax=Serratia plymuthica TaxID=82996 RepID=UPI0018D7C64E|nr:hypothetical protein [Serratia plymuthica]QPS86955.1 hypothetical protein I6G46_22995 [Serratia plymuthica]
MEIIKESEFINFMQSSQQKSKFYTRQWFSYKEEILNWVKLMGSAGIALQVKEDKDNFFVITIAEVLHVKVAFSNKVLNASIKYFVDDGSDDKDLEPFYTLMGDGDKGWKDLDYNFGSNLGVANDHFFSVISSELPKMKP